MRYTGAALTHDHVTAGFDSGKPRLDCWLRDFALTAEAKRISRTFVWAERGQVIAYYTVAAHLLARDALPRPVARGNPDQIPSVLLGRLALDKRLHGQGLGGVLLAEALDRIVDATQIVAARLVVVDAIDPDAVAFYQHFGFRRIPETNRLIQKVGDIAAALR